MIDCWLKYIRLRIEIISQAIATDDPMMYEKRSAVELTGVSVALLQTTVSTETHFAV